MLAPVEINKSAVAISVQVLPAAEAYSVSEPLVLLHGWGCDSRSWQPLVECLSGNYELWKIDLPGFAGSEFIETDRWFEALLAVLPPRAAYLGWSLGGMLATHLAAHYPERVSRLVTLGSNLKFVADEDWPAAMDSVTYRRFCDAFADNGASALKRFAGLMAAGDVDRERLKELRKICAAAFDDRPHDSATNNWHEGLKLLGQIDNKEAFRQLTQPGLHLFAVDDALVPVAACAAMSSLNPSQTCESLSETCHALHWSKPELIAGRILEFLPVVQQKIDKRSVAESFSRAATSYDSVAHLQRTIGEHLLSRFAADAACANTSRVLDLGSGTGYFSPALSPLAQELISLDLAEGMLAYAKQQHPGLSVGVCGDAEQLPFADNTFDRVFSSLSIQWCTNLPQLFTELKRILRPGGRAHIATLGPRTLWELRDAWSQVDAYTHVNSFDSRADLEEAAGLADLSMDCCEEQEIVLRYGQVRELTYELKALGAHNMNAGRVTGLTGRQRIKAFKHAYDSHRETGGLLPATYEVFYLSFTA